MSLVLLGESKARYKGEWLPAVEALKKAGLEPISLAAKEGLALLNGTQVSLLMHYVVYLSQKIFLLLRQYVAA